MPDLLKAIDYEVFLYDHEEARTAQTRWANVCEFAEWLNKKGEEDGKTLIDMVQSIALINMLEKQNSDEYDAVQLSTLHAAKGLEYKHVFLVGVDECILPHLESQDPAKLQEERRLMYVGITRAQRSLHISYCEKRKQARELIPCEPSRFIAEMGKEDVRFTGGKQATPPDKATGSARLDAMKALLALILFYPLGYGTLHRVTSLLTSGGRLAALFGTRQRNQANRRIVKPTQRLKEIQNDQATHRPRHCRYL